MRCATSKRRCAARLPLRRRRWPLGARELRCRSGLSSTAEPPDTSLSARDSDLRARSQRGQVSRGRTCRTSSPGAELAGEWWQLFHSPPLDQVVRAALAASPTLVAANATLAQAREEVNVARGAFLPSVKRRSAGAASTRQGSAGASARQPSGANVSTASVFHQLQRSISSAARGAPSSSSRRSPIPAQRARGRLSDPDRQCRE